MQYAILVVSAAKLIIEIAVSALLAQFFLGIFILDKNNFFYQVLQIVAQPFLRMTRWIVPRFIECNRIPFFALLILAFAWILITALKIYIVLPWKW